MKLLEKFVNTEEITPDELKEIGWCCVHYQRSVISSGEDCENSCPAYRGVSFTKGYAPDTLCERCIWRLIGDFKIPKELQEYSYIYNLGPRENRKAQPNFQTFFNKLKEKFETLCKKANHALQRCHGKYSPPREYCSSCPLQKVCA